MITGNELSKAMNKVNKSKKIEEFLKQQYKGWNSQSLIDELVKLQIEYDYENVEREYDTQDYGK